MAEIKAGVTAFIEDQPYQEVCEFDPNCGEYVHKLIVKGTLPDVVRKHVYHAISDLRHALDQAVYASVCVLTGAPPVEDAYFPWARSRKDMLARLRAKKIPEVLHPVIGLFEPYARGDHGPGGDDIFRLLGKVAGPNKHQVAISAKPSVSTFDLSGSGFTRVPYEPWDSSKNELIIAYVAAPDDRNYEVQISMYVTFDNIDGAELHVVEGTLQYWAQRVGEVIAVLEAESHMLRAKRT
jgi:hypothetical protein